MARPEDQKNKDTKSEDDNENRPMTQEELYEYLRSKKGREEDAGQEDLDWVVEDRKRKEEEEKNKKEDK